MSVPRLYDDVHLLNAIALLLMPTGGMHPFSAVIWRNFIELTIGMFHDTIALLELTKNILCEPNHLS